MQSVNASTYNNFEQAGSSAPNPLIAKVHAYQHKHAAAQTILSVIFPILVKYYPDMLAEDWLQTKSRAADVIIDFPGLGKLDEAHPHNKITGISGDELNKLDAKKKKLALEQEAINKMQDKTTICQVCSGGGNPPPSPLLKAKKIESFFSKSNEITDMLKLFKTPSPKIKFEEMLGFKFLSPTSPEIKFEGKLDFTMSAVKLELKEATLNLKELEVLKPVMETEEKTDSFTFFWFY